VRTSDAGGAEPSRDVGPPGGAGPAATASAEWVITEAVVAAVAAHAASTVAGVVRLEPGLLGLVGSVSRSARQHSKGLDPAPTEGVRVTFNQTSRAPQDRRRVWLEVDVVTSAQDQAAAVGHAVQRTLTRAVTAATGLAVDGVTVSILDVDLAGTGGR
jgi:uncharacterized alkaline shock family protein YloU